MNRKDITPLHNGNDHFLGFELARPLQHGDSRWAIPSNEYQLHVLDYYGGQLMQIKGVKQHAVDPQNIRIWVSDKAAKHRDSITEKVMRILKEA